jgi:hypothetical protein
MEVAGSHLPSVCWGQGAPSRRFLLIYPLATRNPSIRLASDPPGSGFKLGADRAEGSRPIAFASRACSFAMMPTARSHHASV